MRSTSNVIYGITGQTLEYRVPQGRPTSATGEVFYDTGTDDSTPLWTFTATVDSVNTTLTAASGLGQTDATKLNVSPTSFVTTRKYLISEASMKEWITPAQIAAAAVYARHPLQNAYTTSATVVGTTLIATVDSTFIADASYISDQKDQNPGYRVRWEIVVGSTTTVAYTFFDVVRSIVTHQVDIEDINARAPGLMDTLPIDYRTEQGRPLLDAAWQSVQAKLASIGVDTDALRDDQILDELVVLRSLCILALGGWRPSTYDSVGAYLAAVTEEYNTFLEQHFSVTLKHRIAEGTSGAADTVHAQPFWSK